MPAVPVLLHPFAVLHAVFWASCSFVTSPLLSRTLAGECRRRTAASRDRLLRRRSAQWRRVPPALRPAGQLRLARMPCRALRRDSPHPEASDRSVGPDRARALRVAWRWMWSPNRRRWAHRCPVWLTRKLPQWVSLSGHLRGCHPWQPRHHRLLLLSSQLQPHRRLLHPISTQPLLPCRPSRLIWRQIHPSLRHRLLHLLLHRLLHLLLHLLHRLIYHLLLHLHHRQIHHPQLSRSHRQSRHPL